MTATRAMSPQTALETLASVPMFSWDLATDLVCSRFGFRRARAVKEISGLLPDLIRTGGVERIGALYKVAEGLVPQTVESSMKVWLPKAAQLFADYCNAQLRDPMRAIMGDSVYWLYSTTFSAISGASGETEVASLVHRIYAANEYGRRGDIHAARQIVGKYLGEHHRLSRFTLAIELWHSGATAEEKLKALKIDDAEQYQDTAAAVAFHLSGVLCMKQSRFSEGELHLRDSIALFSALNDNLGATKAMTSLARLIRSKGEVSGNFSAINDSLNFFDHSDRLARNLESGHRFERDLALGRTEIGRSRAYLALRMRESALRHASLAVTQLRESPDAQLWARTNLAEIQLSLGLVPEARDTWGDYFDLALESGASDDALVAALISLLTTQARSGELAASATLIERGIEIARRGGLDEDLGALYFLRSESNLASWYRARMVNAATIMRSLNDAKRSERYFLLTGAQAKKQEASRQAARIRRIISESSMSADHLSDRSEPNPKSTKVRLIDREPKTVRRVGV